MINYFVINEGKHATVFGNLRQFTKVNLFSFINHIFLVQKQKGI